MVVIEVNFSRQTAEAGGGSSKGGYSPAKQSEDPITTSSDLFQNSLGTASLIKDQRVNRVSNGLVDAAIVGGITGAVGGAGMAQAMGCSKEKVLEAAVIWGGGSAIGGAVNKALDLMSESEIEAQIKQETTITQVTINEIHVHHHHHHHHHHSEEKEKPFEGGDPKID